MKETSKLSRNDPSSPISVIKHLQKESASKHGGGSPSVEELEVEEVTVGIADIANGSTPLQVSCSKEETDTSGSLLRDEDQPDSEEAQEQ